jgi:putative tryptophan/tyrosine transport system substrate-binding protein
VAPEAIKQELRSISIQLMKRTSIISAILAAAAIAFGVAACNRRDAGVPEPAAKTIAIANLQKHPILDAVEQGVVDELKREGYGEGPSARYIFRNAGGDMQQVSSIAAELAARNPDVVVAISTPIAQAVVKKFKGKIVFGALTDPISAGIVTSLDGSNPNVTGTTDAIPYGEQLNLIRKLSPTAKRLGLLFNPGEAPSQYAVKRIKELAPQFGFELVEGPANSTQDVYPVALGLAGRVDVFLISTDNTVAAGIAGAVKVGIQRKVPVYACDSGSVEKGAIAAVSPGYYDIGLETGRLAARALKGEANLPIVQPRSGQVYLNRKAAELMSISLPSDLLSHAAKVFEEIK